MVCRPLQIFIRLQVPSAPPAAERRLSANRKSVRRSDCSSLPTPDGAGRPSQPLAALASLPRRRKHQPPSLYQNPTRQQRRSRSCTPTHCRSGSASRLRGGTKPRRRASASESTAKNLTDSSGEPTQASHFALRLRGYPRKLAAALASLPRRRVSPSPSQLKTRPLSSP